MELWVSCTSGPGYNLTQMLAFKLMFIVTSVRCCCKSLMIWLCFVCHLSLQPPHGGWQQFLSTPGFLLKVRLEGALSSWADALVSHLLAVWVRALSSVSSGPLKSPTSPTSLSLRSQRSALLLVFTETLPLVQSCSWHWQNFFAWTTRRILLLQRWGANARDCLGAFQLYPEKTVLTGRDLPC